MTLVFAQVLPWLREQDVWDDAAFATVFEETRVDEREPGPGARAADVDLLDAAAGAEGCGGGGG